MGKKITFAEALLTAVGLVIGSGIFFRADNILEYTQGNVFAAVVGWVLLGTTLVFGGIGMSVLAGFSKREGGIVGYMEDCFGKTAAFITGWFTTTIYIPTLIGILSIVASGYLLNLVGIEHSALRIQGTAGAMIALIFLWNYLSTKFASLFSSAATIIKLLPLVLIGFIGMARYDSSLISEGINTFEVGLLTAPLLSMAFAFDGWTTVASLSRDMVNPQRDIALVLAINAIIVTVAYVLYFTGMTMILSANDIIGAGDAHVGMAAQEVLGNIGEKFILFCVVISVMGTLNGNIMAGFRYPHALAQSKDLPNSDFFVQESKYSTTAKASLISLVAVIFWFVLYTIQAFASQAKAIELAANRGLTEAQVALEKSNHLFGGISFDDIPIMTIAAVIIVLLIGAIMVASREKVGIVKGLIAPLIGILGQAYVIFSFIQTNESWLTYMIVCVVIILGGYLMRRQVKKQSDN